MQTYQTAPPCAQDAPHGFAAPTAYPNLTGGPDWTWETCFRACEHQHGMTEKEWPPLIHSDWGNYWHPRYGGEDHHAHTPEYMDALRAERRLETVEPAPPFQGRYAKEVGAGTMRCPVCDGLGKVFLAGVGRDTGIPVRLPRPCICRTLISLHGVWERCMAGMDRFRHVRLNTLAPDARLSTLPVARQAAIIGHLKAHPDDSYLLYGSPGTGKTHYMTALFRRAVSAWVERTDQGTSGVWRVSTAQLLDEHVAWETRKDGAEVRCPKVLKSHIQASAAKGFRPRLFLDELDKVVLSEFKANRLIGLIDAVYEAQGQVVATSNKSPTQLAKAWGTDEAGTILRRITSGDNAQGVYFG